jgi:hypothetical protein
MDDEAAATAGRPRWGRALRQVLRGMAVPAADLVFTALLLATLLLGGWLAARHEQSWDLTTGARNSLSAESRAVLERLAEPLDIHVYAPRGAPVARAVEQLLERYRRLRPILRIQWLDPALFPEQARADDVRVMGQLVLEYRGRRETLTRLGEAALTNAMARLLLTDPPWVAVLEGHGERAIDGGGTTDLGRYGQLLRQRGFRLQPLDLALGNPIPDNTAWLLLATPALPLFPGEATALAAYLERGGNLLWLLDPSLDPGSAPEDSGAAPLQGLQAIADTLGLRLLPGVVVDAAAGELGLDAPTTAVVAEWPEHPVGAGLGGPALLPGSRALADEIDPAWRIDAALRTGALSWNETGPVRGEIERDAVAGEQGGPLSVALVLTRPLDAAHPPLPAAASPDPPEPPRAAGSKPAAEQRIIVVGDGDFLSNAHLHQGANRRLGLRIARWLAGREDLVRINKTPTDTGTLALSPLRTGLISGIGLIGLPLLLIMLGLGIRWRRRRG